ncbi:unnamed protein product, partial [Mesorhabditis belari]|uniref:RNA helicase n=1 Tax=Mesorhabditis belari TaxID=2138241 RepID=A0AAF3FFH0_9BILA
MSHSDDEEVDFTDIHQASNRKNKKAGGWQALGFDHTVSKGIEKKGFKQPTPIQRKTIPCILDGKDVVAMSRTGSGKTAAFVIPMLQKLKRRETVGARALLVAPSRELALQTFKVVKELGRFTGLRCAAVVGGDRIEDQFGTIHENPDIIIATPGRLLHVLLEMDLRLKHVQYVVFDEADRLFEMGFEQQLLETLKRLPESRQTLLFSATLPKILIDFAKAGLSDPVLVRLDVDEKISERLSMAFCTCRADEKLATLLWLCRKMEHENQHTVIFCATMKHVEYVVAILNRAGIDVSFLYSQLDATARKLNIAKFREKETKLLVVTDVAARGVDIPLLDVVINLHFPAKAKLFVHRVGRVARAGRKGMAISLLAPDEIPYLCDLFLFLGKPMIFAKDTDEMEEKKTLIGRVPSSVVGVEIDFLKSIHDNNEDLKDLRHKAINAMNKFTQTRTPPSAESSRRTKDEIRTKIFESSIHPYLRVKGDAENQKLLNQLSNYKSRATIFELHGGEKKEAARVMRDKRQHHQNHIEEVSETKGREQVRLIEEEAAKAKINLDEEADELLLKSTFASVIGSSGTNKSIGKSRENERRRQKEEHFIPYIPSDHQAEKQLQVEKHDFAREAAKASVDICGDDDPSLRKSQSTKKWDRKLKRFVGASGDEPGSKRVRTEEGTWVPASYKSGRYERWKQTSKVSYEKGGEDGDGEENSDVQKFNPNKKFNRSMKNQKNTRNELKSKDEMLKGRRRKEKVASYQNYRAKENAKRSQASGGFKGKGQKRNRK